MRGIKSQAALEFIMTYGWAILVVLIAISALAYFGVLSPDRFLPNKCTLQAGIACVDHKLTPTSLTVVMQNSLGYDVTITALMANQCTAQTGLAVSFPNGAKYTTPAFACVNAGSKYKGNFNITYSNTDTGIAHTNQGQITAKIE